MAERDTFVTIADGDQLSEGYFNGIQPEINTKDKFTGIKGCSSPLNRNVYNHEFTADDATTSTNFTYDATADDYTVIGTDTGTLITAAVDTTATGTGIAAISKAFCKWDYYKFTVYDECDDSSVDTSLWDNSSNDTSGEVLAEDTEKLSYTWEGESTTANYLIIDTDSTNGVFTDETVVLRCILSSVRDSGTNGDVYVKITDGSNTVTIEEYNEVAAANVSAKYIFSFDDTNNLVYVWKDGTVLDSSPFNISSVTGGYQIRLESRAGGGGNNHLGIEVYYLRKIDGSEVTTVTESFSSDNGSNYDTANNGYVNVTSANQSYRMVGRLTSTPVAGEGVCVNRIDFQGFTDND